MAKDNVDPVITDHVEQVANRFGVTGLEDLIEVATERLEKARAAIAQLPPS